MSPTAIIQAISNFLLMFMPKTLVKRIIAMILLSADVPVSRVMEISGLCDRSVRGLKKSLAEGETDSLLKLKNGTGSGSKTKGIGEEIIAEVEKNNYHTHRQIAGMIEEKFHIKISVTAVARLLKKTALKN